MLETRTVGASAQVLRRNDGDWVQSQSWGGALAQKAEWAGDGKNTQSKGPLRVGKSPFQGFTQSKGTAKEFYTVKSNRQLVRGTGTRAIGGGRGEACVGGRAIGGDALAMQVHAGSWRHLPTLISAAHARRKRKPGRLLRQRGDAGWSRGRVVGLR